MLPLQLGPGGLARPLGVQGHPGGAAGSLKLETKSTRSVRSAAWPFCPSTEPATSALPRTPHSAPSPSTRRQGEPLRLLQEVAVDLRLKGPRAGGCTPAGLELRPLV